MTSSICEKCGAELRISEYPFCPHGFGSGLAVGDDIPGGQVIENLDHEPVTVYSHSQLRAEADKRGLRLRDQWAGPGDRYLSNWSAVSARTLHDAKVLLERVGQASTTAEQCRATLDTATFTVTEWRES